MLNYSVLKCGDTEEIVLSNGVIKLVIVPEQGGRILEFSIDNLNVLFRNTKYIGTKANIEVENRAENWMNFGGYKGWPAPQSKWAWPPIFDIDLNVFQYEILKTEGFIMVMLSSPVSKTLGIKFIREIIIEEGCNYITLKETIVNCNDNPVEWGVWGITQALTPGYAEVKLNSDVFTGGVTFYQDFDIPSGNAYSIRKEDGKILTVNCNNQEQFKVGIVTDNETIKYYCTAYKDKTLLFTQKFQYEGQVVYPHGSNVEIYVDNSLPYTELEVLGGISEIMPNESRSIKMIWQLELVK
ncbi:MAG: DUF4380 domain-containing protein [Clostridiaceae bacterium]